MKKENGITLIALVVTIIILIILSAITFSVILGENGVIDKAKEASKDMDIKTVEEKLILEKGELAIEKKGGKILVEEYLQYIAAKGIINLNQNNKQPNGSTSIIVNTYEFLVEQITENDIKIEYMGLAEDRDITFPNQANIIITGDIEQDKLPVSINIQVEHIDNESGVDIKKCKWVYNTSAEEIGTDESLYTEEFTTNPQTITINIEEKGDYYLHILTVDSKENKTETIKGPITVTEKYHKHSGNETLEGDCYTKPYYTYRISCSGTLTYSGANATDPANGKRYYTFSCNKCGFKYNSYSTTGAVIGNGQNSAPCSSYSGSTTGTGYSVPAGATIVSTTYELTCGKDTSTIEGYKITY